MNFPDNLKYSSDHEWVRVDGNETYVGISDFAQSELGEIVFVDIATEGENIDKGAVFGSIEAVKTVSDLLMPVTGKIIEVNPQLDDQPELVNNDPYGEGWLVKISVENKSELNELLSSADYKALIGK